MGKVTRQDKQLLWDEFVRMFCQKQTFQGKQVYWWIARARDEQDATPELVFDWIIEKLKELE